MYKLSMNSGIYIIENKQDGKIYVGSSVNVTTRLKQHITKLKYNKHSNSHLQRAWNKYGEASFLYYKIADISKELLRFVEQKCIDSLSENDYNINKLASGGDHGYIQTGIHHKKHRKISVFDLNMNFIEEVSGLRETERKYKTRAVYNCCSGRKKQIKGFIFKYSEDVLSTD